MRNDSNDEMLIAIRSRSEVFALADSLRRWRVPYKIIPTPEKAKLACGLSVKISRSHYGKVISVISALGISVSAILLINTVNGKTEYVRK